MKNIILIINIKNPNRPGRDDAYQYSINSWKQWGRKNGCAVFTLEEPVVPISEMTPIVQRHYVFDLLDNSGVGYDQICMVDADTIVHPDCPNFFDLSDGNYCGVHNDGDYDWVIRSLENYQHHFPEMKSITSEMVWSYINTGFTITNKNHRWFHEKLLDFYWKNKETIIWLQKTYGVGTDQPLVNMLANNSEMEIKILPYQFNMQDLPRKNILDDRMLFTKIPGVYHFNAVPGGPEQVNYWLEKTYKYFYN